MSDEDTIARLERVLQEAEQRQSTEAARSSHARKIRKAMNVPPLERERGSARPPPVVPATRPRPRARRQPVVMRVNHFARARAYVNGAKGSLGRLGPYCLRGLASVAGFAIWLFLFCIRGFMRWYIHCWPTVSTISFGLVLVGVWYVIMCGLMALDQSEMGIVTSTMYLVGGLCRFKQGDFTALVHENVCPWWPTRNARICTNADKTINEARLKREFHDGKGRGRGRGGMGMGGAWDATGKSGFDGQDQDQGGWPEELPKAFGSQMTWESVVESALELQDETRAMVEIADAWEEAEFFWRSWGIGLEELNGDGDEDGLAVEDGSRAGGDSDYAHDPQRAQDKAKQGDGGRGGNAEDEDEDEEVWHVCRKSAAKPKPNPNPNPQPYPQPRPRHPSRSDSTWASSEQRKKTDRRDSPPSNPYPYAYPKPEPEPKPKPTPKSKSKSKPSPLSTSHLQPFDPRLDLVRAIHAVSTPLRRCTSLLPEIPGYTVSLLSKIGVTILHTKAHIAELDPRRPADTKELVREYVFQTNVILRYLERLIAVVNETIAADQRAKVEMIYVSCWLRVVESYLEQQWLTRLRARPFWARSFSDPERDAVELPQWANVQSAQAIREVTMTGLMELLTALREIDGSLKAFQLSIEDGGLAIQGRWSVESHVAVLHDQWLFFSKCGRKIQPDK
ncbi:hypothetical protein MBM_07479 [Drepanopeziza brunnea f. sp. 'multigermtubi' MB_m1]|uniref:Uncharacterized protein n=1 Tax=Marssonina brunnea f. sp. multigermtubi (strain MB_m1) TaxID=1072389 RepID=K1XP45_MARBU|nr:uncharacterized protein MBM_07479 [Drepanopeziza brunnea f. sp. 'multigermtubi' MB_m1]EKD14249.1 hypothetical protein MBM_07479 [Drepanopeziza brunnea f. sp. 'multigermtubi' MB_m1]